MPSRSAVVRSRAYVAAEAGSPAKNAVSKTATWGTSGKASRARRMPSTAGGLCRGARWTRSSMRRTTASSTSTGAVNSGTPVDHPVPDRDQGLGPDARVRKARGDLAEGRAEAVRPDPLEVAAHRGRAAAGIEGLELQRGRSGVEDEHETRGHGHPSVGRHRHRSPLPDPRPARGPPDPGRRTLPGEPRAHGHPSVGRHRHRSPLPDPRLHGPRASGPGTKDPAGGHRAPASMGHVATRTPVPGAGGDP